MTNSNNHKWFICELCGPSVVCGKCGNNTCNAGYGEIDGVRCDKCTDAYIFYSLGYKRRLYHPSTYVWQLKNLITNIRIKLGLY